MIETFFTYFHSLCYGVMIMFFISMIHRLTTCLKECENNHKRFVLRTSTAVMAWLLVQTVLWFIYNSVLIPFHSDALSGCLSILEMMTIPLVGITLSSIVKLKPTKYITVYWREQPLILLFIAQILFPSKYILLLAHAYVILYSVGFFIMIPIYTHRFNAKLNETYSNTSQRGVSWIMSLIAILASVLALWGVLTQLFLSLITSCIYNLLSLIPWLFFVLRLEKQNFNIEMMQEEDEVENLEEEHATGNIVDDTNSEHVTPVEADAPSQTSTPVLNRPKIEINDEYFAHIATPLKAWQEPQFDAAMRAYCSQEKVFTNPELTIMDVARGVNSNRTYVSRWCKENGTDFSTFIINIRLDYAEHLLTSTNDPIIDILTMAGFNNPRHFRNVFYARHECTPSEYRTLHAAHKDSN